jgi:hypothetical protein
MKRFATFIAIGSFFSSVEEFLTVAVLKRDPASFVFTVIVLFPVFLSFVYGSAKLLDKLWPTDAARELAHFVAYGCVGLIVIEWVLIGLTPWSNPEANPLGMALFQLGMFSFWATVAFAPRLFLGNTDWSRRVRKWIVLFYLPYIVCVYVVGLSVPDRLRFATIIPLLIASYLLLDVFYVVYFARAFAEPVPARSDVTAMGMAAARAADSVTVAAPTIAED